MKIPHSILATKLYWKINPFWQKLLFNYHKTANKGRENFKGSLDSLTIFVGFLKKVALGVVLAVIAVCFLEYIEKHLVHTLPQNLGSIQSLIARALGIASLEKLDYGVYRDLAPILAALAGIYFATISIVASTSYSNLSRETRNLVWAEKNNSYFALLVSLIGLLLILSAINAYGYRTGSLVFFCTMFFVLVAVLGFIYVSLNLFRYFDPIILLGNQVMPEVANYIANATVNGFQWNIPAVQQHYQDRAEYCLDIFENITNSSFSIENGKITHGKDQLKHLLVYALRILRFYGIRKAGIPADSYWFRRTNKQLEWFTSSSAVTDIGMNTGGSLQPEQVPDDMWFEKKVTDNIVTILKVALKSEDHTLIAKLYNSIQLHIDYLTKEHSAEAAYYLLDRIRTYSHDFLTNIELTESDYENVEGGLAITLAVADCYGMVPLSIIVGHRKGIEDFEKDKFQKTLSTVKWQSDYGIYKYSFPREVLDQLRYIQKGLRFEIDVEGKALSPQWYLLQLSGIGVLNYLCAIPEKIITMLQKEYVEFSAALIEQKRYIIALQIIERGLEACSKCDAYFAYYERVQSDLEKTQKVQDIPKPNVDWKKIGLELENCREQLIKDLAKVSPLTAEIPQHSSIPDYFGKAYWVMSQECLWCIIENKTDLFKLLFPMYFMHFFSVFGRFLKKFQETNAEFWMIQTIDIARDLLALSGYALIYGELGHDEIWGIVKKTWEGYIAALKEQKKDMDGIILATAKTGLSERPPLTISKRYEVQTGWMQTVSQDLEKKGILREERYYGLRRLRDKPQNHASAIIEYITRHTSMGIWYGTAEKIFVATFILPLLPESLQKDLGREIIRLVEDIKEIERESAAQIAAKAEPNES